MRVHELAKELSVTSKKVIEILKDKGIAVKGHMSSVSSDAIAAVKGILGKDELKQKSVKVKKEKKVPKEKPQKKHDKKVVKETPAKEPVSEKPKKKHDKKDVKKTPDEKQTGT